jgi:immune inhibitor A
VWLRDYAYTDNWTREHIGHGFLLVVDAHDQPINRPSAGALVPGYGAFAFNTHVQISDATFSLDRATDFRVGYWGVAKDYSGLAAVPSFDDSLTYWNVKTPDASTFVPRFGLVLRVLGEANDDSAALIGIGTK